MVFVPAKIMTQCVSEVLKKGFYSCETVKQRGKVGKGWRKGREKPLGKNLRPVEYDKKLYIFK